MELGDSDNIWGNLGPYDPIFWDLKNIVYSIVLDLSSKGEESAFFKRVIELLYQVRESDK